MEVKIQGNQLIISVDISDKAIKAAPLSSSGKNKLVDTTGGFQAVTGKPNLKFALNVTAKP